MSQLPALSLRLALPLLALTLGCGGAETARSAECKEGAPARVSGRLVLEGEQSLEGAVVSVALLSQGVGGEFSSDYPLLLAVEPRVTELPERFELCGEVPSELVNAGPFRVQVFADANRSGRRDVGDLEGRAELASVDEPVKDLEVRVTRVE